MALPSYLTSCFHSCTSAVWFLILIQVTQVKVMLLFRTLDRLLAPSKSESKFLYGPLPVRSLAPSHSLGTPLQPLRASLPFEIVLLALLPQGLCTCSFVPITSSPLVSSQDQMPSHGELFLGHSLTIEMWFPWQPPYSLPALILFNWSSVYIWHCVFKVHSVWMWYIYVLQYDRHCSLANISIMSHNDHFLCVVKTFMIFAPQQF